MRIPTFPPPCFEFLHAELIEATDGRAVVRFSPDSQMENPYGLIQGGLLAGMLDNCIGPAVVSAVPDRQTTTLQMSTHYLSPAKAGDVLLGTANVVKYGKTQAVIETRLVREKTGEVIAIATATNIFLGEVPNQPPQELLHQSK